MHACITIINCIQVVLYQYLHEEGFMSGVYPAHQEPGSEARYMVDKRESQAPLWSIPFKATTSAGKFPLYILSC